MNILIIILYVYPLLGKCRIIDPLYEYEILQYMCKLATARKYGFDRIKMPKIVKTTKDIYPEEIVKYVFIKYTVPSPKSVEASVELLFKYVIIV